VSRREDIKKLMEHAKNKSGKFLSINYKNNEEKLEWQCEKGHIWSACWNHIKNNDSWCPICANNIKNNIIELQKYAISKNGLLLSTEYNNNKQLLKWQCEKGHQWKTAWQHIKNKHSWCPTCSNNMPEIDKLQQFAKNKNGLLLSKKYKNSRTSVEWQCEKNHIWSACWNNIKKGSWCSICSAFKKEIECKELLEKKVNVIFIKKRFYHDSKFKHKYLEFDGYNEEKKVAFEYQGYQHYIFPNFWHKTKEEFEAGQKRDELKRQYCIENNIKLIIIPYTEQNNLKNFINSLSLPEEMIIQ
jgi:hypothetical protein